MRLATGKPNCRATHPKVTSSLPAGAAPVLGGSGAAAACSASDAASGPTPGAPGPVLQQQEGPGRQTASGASVLAKRAAHLTPDCGWGSHPHCRSLGESTGKQSKRCSPHLASNTYTRKASSSRGGLTSPLHTGRGWQSLIVVSLWLAPAASSRQHIGLPAALPASLLLDLAGLISSNPPCPPTLLPPPLLLPPALLQRPQPGAPRCGRRRLAPLGNALPHEKPWRRQVLRPASPEGWCGPTCALGTLHSCAVDGAALGRQCVTGPRRM